MLRDTHLLRAATVRSDASRALPNGGGFYRDVITRPAPFGCRLHTLNILRVLSRSSKRASSSACISL